MVDPSEYIEQTKRWIERFVIGLNLCPFAAIPFLENKIAYSVLKDNDLQMIAEEILTLCDQLNKDKELETRFVITPEVDLDFESFYHFVSSIQEYIDQHCSPKTILVAFHPHFQYQGSEPKDNANTTNQSPFAMIHLLKKESMDDAERSDVHIGQLLHQNQQVLRSMSSNDIKKLRN